MSYKYSAKKPERSNSMLNEKNERSISFSDDSFPELSKADTVSFKPATVWKSSISLCEKLKEIAVAEDNLIVQPPVFPNMRVRVIDNPTLHQPIDDDHPTLKLVERLENLRYARLERDRLKANELKAMRKAEGLDDDDYEIDSIDEYEDNFDDISETYSEYEVPDNKSCHSEDTG
jgi:hypothetical protein